MVKTVAIPRHITHVVGIDEAGRGSIAGPVAVGIVSIPVSGGWKVPEEDGLRDSKKLPPQKREEWFAHVAGAARARALCYTCATTSSAVIDRIGIVPGVRRAIARGLSRMDIRPDRTLILLDGGLVAPDMFPNQNTIIKGDEKEPVIALASIVAKVSRDRKMIRLASRFPQYNFDKHKGYGTRAHYADIRTFGISDMHRKSFLRGLAE